MQRVLITLLAMFLLLLAPACSKDNTDPPADKKNTITLNDLDGWWYLADGYPGQQQSMVQMFRLDAGAGTWNTLDDWGEEYYTDKAYLDDEGRLCLAFQPGDAYFLPEGNSVLLDAETGETAYIKGSAPEENSLGSLEGKWYKNGDASAGYYLFAGNTIKQVGAHVDPASISGIPYRLAEQEYTQPDHSMASGIGIIRDDAYAIETFILSDDKTYFFVPYHNEFYLREDVIGTARGEEIAAKYRLMSANWRGSVEQGHVRLELCDNDIFVYNRQTSQGVELMDNGSWDLAGDTLTLTFTDGSSEVFKLTPDTQSITVKRFGMTFNKA